MKGNGLVTNGDQIDQFYYSNRIMEVHKMMLAKLTCPFMKGVITMIKKIKEFMEDLIYFVKES